MSNAFLYRMPAGIAGDVQRKEHATIEPGIYDANYPCLAFGIVVKIVGGLVRPIASGDDPDALTLGFLCRPYPFQEPIGTSISDEGMGSGVPNPLLTADVMKRGYMTVKITTGGSDAFADVVKGDPVYVRVTADTGKAVGDLEAGSASGNHLVPGAYFMGGVDANGFAEIAYNL